MSIAIAALVGVLAGTHAATWGAYKDSPFEGFRLRSYLRTVLLASSISLSLTLWPGHALAGHSRIVAVLGAVYAIERLATEWWKAILRNEDQSVYTIPMRLGFGGRPVDRKGIRYSVGGAVILGIVAVGAVIEQLQHTYPHPPAWLIVPTIGAAGGWATAVGGAWKDAPIEGFSGWKFLRSPAVATAWAIPLSLLASNWVFLLLASGGFAVASIETYKTFFTGGRAPGKFADRPVRHYLPIARRWLGRLHATLWAALGIGLMVSLPQPEHGVSADALSAVATQLPNLLLTAVAASAAVFAALILNRNTHLTTIGAT
ncbi:MAG: hypothetical protein H7288_24140 [Kineosporiaceae bacterium]|nr:hypothetical protein [Aeromicrobium sp.]